MTPLNTRLELLEVHEACGADGPVALQGREACLNLHLRASLSVLLSAPFAQREWQIVR